MEYYNRYVITITKEQLANAIECGMTPEEFAEGIRKEAEEMLQRMKAWDDIKSLNDWLRGNE